jgi:hypothetical protein
VEWIKQQAKALGYEVVSDNLIKQAQAVQVHLPPPHDTVCARFARSLIGVMCAYWRNGVMCTCSRALHHVLTNRFQDGKPVLMDGQEEVEQGAEQQTENPTDKPKEEAVEEKRKKRNGLVKQGSSEQRKRTDKAQEKEAAVSVRVLHIYIHAAVSVRVLLHIYIYTRYHRISFGRCGVWDLPMFVVCRDAVMICCHPLVCALMLSLSHNTRGDVCACR